MHKRTARDALLQPWGINGMVSPYLGISRKETERRLHEVEVIKKKLLGRHGNGNVINISC